MDGREKTLLVHRKGSTRAFPPHHPLIPVDYQVGYACATIRVVSQHCPALTPFALGRRALAGHHQFTGQPVLIGGTMGTCSYVLTGTQKGMQETFGSTCHGAGRASSRAKSRSVSAAQPSPSDAALL